MCVEFYERLVYKTAGMYESSVEEEFEDLVQILRIKAWRALESYDPTRSKMPVERYVFGCIRNQVKDLLKKKRHPTFYMDGLPYRRWWMDGGVRDAFEYQHLREDEEVVFAEILSETPMLPETLTPTEKEIVVLLYLENDQRTIARRLGVPYGRVVRLVASIREQLRREFSMDS